MGNEVTKYDKLAKYIYELHNPDGKHFNHIPRIERDYWRAHAQVSAENYRWPRDMKLI